MNEAARPVVVAGRAKPRGLARLLLSFVLLTVSWLLVLLGR